MNARGEGRTGNLFRFVRSLLRKYKVADDGLCRRNGRTVGVKIQENRHGIREQGHNRYLPTDGNATDGARRDTSL